MRKMTCLILALVLCLSIAAPAFASENGFVPSITYKPDPKVIPVTNAEGEAFLGVIRDENGDVLDYFGHGCLLITPVAHVWDEEISVPDAVANLLTKVYTGLNDGSMKLPYEKHNADLNPANMVIRDLFDARWVCEEHREMVEKEGVTFAITFDLNVDADAQVFVMTYDEAADQWDPIVKTENHGDGTVTCTFEHLCAIAFSMPVAAPSVPADTAPSPTEQVPNAEPPVEKAPNVLPWIVVLVLAAVGAVATVLVRKKKQKVA